QDAREVEDPQAGEGTGAGGGGSVGHGTCVEGRNPRLIAVRPDAEKRPMPFPPARLPAVPGAAGEEGGAPTLPSCSGSSRASLATLALPSGVDPRDKP